MLVDQAGMAWHGRFTLASSFTLGLTRCFLPTLKQKRTLSEALRERRRLRITIQIWVRTSGARNETLCGDTNIRNKHTPTSASLRLGKQNIDTVLEWNNIEICDWLGICLYNICAWQD